MFVQSLRSAVLFVVIALGAVTCPSSLLAQHGAVEVRGRLAARASTVPMPARVDTVNPAPAAGPRIAPTGFTRHTVAQSEGPTRPIADSRRGDNANVATMGIGAAVVGLGRIIGGTGGTIVVATGGVVGLVGLYRYLR